MNGAFGAALVHDLCPRCKPISQLPVEGFRRDKSRIVTT